MKFQVTFRDNADPDLIKWYKETPDGDRSYIVRQALRDYLSAQTVPAAKEEPPKKPVSKALKNLEL